MEPPSAGMPRKRLKQMAPHWLWVKRGRPPKALTQATKSKRLEFARANRSGMWAVVLFTDRKRFLLSYPGSKVRMIRWVEAGPEAEEQLAVYQPNHPQSVNIYAGITKYGVTRVHVVAGSSKHTSNFHNKKGEPAKNITAEEYRHSCVVQHLASRGQKTVQHPGHFNMGASTGQ